MLEMIKVFYVEEFYEKNEIYYCSFSNHFNRLMIEGLDTSPKMAVLFTTIMFTLSHPFMWGVFSHTLREPAMIVSLLIMGCLWGTIYIKTKNLWLCVISHMFVDFFNMSIFSFLDMITLGGR
ncbi:MAG: CPBP family intramembrane metalloprotease [Cellulosilyticum sp.]|nr:CPBP family intramembrane metalloprotease [Cellulosilyticum sp.]